MLINSQIANFSFLFLFISMICYWIGPLSRDLFGQSSKKNAKDMQEAQIQETSLITGLSQNSLLKGDVRSSSELRTSDPIDINGKSSAVAFFKEKGETPVFSENGTVEKPLFARPPDDPRRGSLGGGGTPCSENTATAVFATGAYGKENSNSGPISDFSRNSEAINWFSPQVTIAQDLPFLSTTTSEISLSQNPSTFHFDITQGLQLMGRIAIIVSNLLLVILLCNRWKESGHFPLSNLYESLMFLSWSFTLIHLFIENWTQGEKTEEMSMGKYIGAITTPSALFTNAFATFTLPKEMQGSSSLVPALQSNWLMMHVTVMILSYAALILGSLLSIAFLIITIKKNDLKSSVAFFEEKGVSEGKSSDEIAVFAENGTPGGGDKPYNKNSSSFCENGTKENFQRVAQGDGDRPSLTDFSTVPSSPRTGTPEGGGGTPLSKKKFHLISQDSQFDSKTAIDGLITSASEFNLESSNSSYTLNEMSKENKRNFIASTLDNLSYRILGIGFPFLTIGILSGAVWANEAWGSYWSWDPKETWALLTWLIYAIYLHTRLNKGWEGKKPAVIASLGFVVVWICYLGVNLIGEGLHSYGWIVQ